MGTPIMLELDGLVGSCSCSWALPSGCCLAATGRHPAGRGQPARLGKQLCPVELAQKAHCVPQPHACMLAHLAFQAFAQTGAWQASPLGRAVWVKSRAALGGESRQAC